MPATGAWADVSGTVKAPDSLGRTVPSRLHNWRARPGGPSPHRPHDPANERDFGGGTFPELPGCCRLHSRFADYCSLASTFTNVMAGLGVPGAQSSSYTAFPGTGSTCVPLKNN